MDKYTAIEEGVRPGHAEWGESAQEVTEVERALSRVRASEQYTSEQIGRGIETIRSWRAASGNHDVAAVLSAAERYRSVVNAAADHERRRQCCGEGCDDAFPSTVNPFCPLYGYM